MIRYKAIDGPVLIPFLPASEVANNIYSYNYTIAVLIKFNQTADSNEVEVKSTRATKKRGTSAAAQKQG